MSRDTDQDQSKITNFEQLIHYFHEGNTEKKNRRVGTEHEKFVFRKDKVGYPLIQFQGDRGIESILENLVERFNWAPHYDDQHLLTLTKNHAAISLEPAGQFELSGRPVDTIHETKEELFEHFRELNDVSGDFALYTSFGSNPFCTGGELPWLPRNRYRIMRNYMAKQGRYGHWMMQTTCTIQANFDYLDEADAADIIHTAILISPIINGIFSNSKIVAGHKTDYQSFRARIWEETDNDRCGVPPFMYEPNFTFKDYVEWAIDVPMYFIRREGRYIAANGLPFRRFLEDGLKAIFDGTEVVYEANIGDFELHLSTLFPEVRLKRYIEVRSADGGPIEHILALPAIWKGILYDDTARNAAKALISSRGEAHRALTHRIAEEGIHATDIEGRPFIDIANDLISLSKSGLDRIAKECGHPSETEFLLPLEQRLSGDAPYSLADTFAEAFEQHGGRRDVLVPFDMLAPFRS